MTGNTMVKKAGLFVAAPMMIGVLGGLAAHRLEQLDYITVNVIGEDGKVWEQEVRKNPHSVSHKLHRVLKLAVLS